MKASKRVQEARFVSAFAKREATVQMRHSPPGHGSSRSARHPQSPGPLKSTMVGPVAAQQRDQYCLTPDRVAPDGVAKPLD